jgi:hypothetical protein
VTDKGRICPLRLLKADTMMCRSISGISILVSMQFFPNYRITMTTHIAMTIITIHRTVSFMTVIASTSGTLHSEFIRLLFLQTHRETDRFFAVSGVQLAQPNRGLFHFLLTVFSTTLKVKVGSTLVKTENLRITLNIDGSSITSRTHTHPSHSQTSRLLNSSISLGVPVPRVTQCMWDV